MIYENFLKMPSYDRHLFYQYIHLIVLSKRANEKYILHYIRYA